MNEARILIVEDDAILAWDLETILAQEGHRIVGRAGTFENALALAEIEMPDLVIMDLKLAQGTSGLATASEIYHRFGIRSLFVSAISIGLWWPRRPRTAIRSAFWGSLMPRRNSRT